MHQKNGLVFCFFELISLRMEKIMLPVSKSLYIRKLICNFLKRRPLDKVDDGFPVDVRIVRDCLARIAEAESGQNPADKPVCIDVRDCGAAYRFLMAVLAITPGQWLLTGTERLLHRPIEELVEALRSIGADVQYCSRRDGACSVSFDNVVSSCKDGACPVPNDGDVYPFGDGARHISNDGDVYPFGDGARHISSVGDVYPFGDGARHISSVGNVYPFGDGARTVSTNAEYGCWQIHGKTLHASEMTIDCTRSGQFATALLLIADKIGLQELHVQPEKPSSVAYIAMTKAVINGEADLTPQRLGDWSAAVYWYANLLLSQQQKNGKWELAADADVMSAAGAKSFVCSELRNIEKNDDIPTSYKLMRMDLASIQSDAVLARWFSEWGVESRQEEDGVVISYNERFIKQQEVVELDMSQNVDLVPVLACMACLWPKKMIFNGVANLRYKESDRLKVIQEQLSAFADIKLNTYNGIVDNQLVVNPRKDGACLVSDSGGALFHRDRACPVSTCSYGNNANCSGADFVFDAHNDHRFVMGFSLFTLKGKVQIKGFDCVRKSYPDFHAEGIVGGTDVVG